MIRKEKDMKKKLLFVFVSFFLLLVPFTAKAVTGKDGFLIKEYNVDIIVNENNSYDITETINVVFDDPSKHGIFRKIPYNVTYHRYLNDKELNIKQRVRIKNVSVNNNFTKEEEDGYLTVKIGKAYETVQVDTLYTYVIKYTYDVGDDNIADYDDVYFNIIGQEWSTYIEDVKFTIGEGKTLS